MILRNAEGQIVIVNRANFTCDKHYHEYIYRLMIPFSDKYKASFTKIQ